MERVEENPFWNFVYSASTGEPSDIEEAVKSLREIPLDLIDWKMENSHRADLRFSPPMKNGERLIIKPLPWTERPIHKWDSNPYTLDRGNALGEEDPTLWLLPYWMGRYYRLIE